MLTYLVTRVSVSNGNHVKETPVFGDDNSNN